MDIFIVHPEQYAVLEFQDEDWQKEWLSFELWLMAPVM